MVHQKGRKKTTEAESGITVGSVAPAAVLDKMSKKKSKEGTMDFYRFQRREAQRNGMLLSSLVAESFQLSMFIFLSLYNVL